jgi:hypothetical protein
MRPPSRASTEVLLTSVEYRAEIPVGNSLVMVTPAFKRDPGGSPVEEFLERITKHLTVPAGMN